MHIPTSLTASHAQDHHLQVCLNTSTPSRVRPSDGEHTRHLLQRLVRALSGAVNYAHGASCISSQSQLLWGTVLEWFSAQSLQQRRTHWLTGWEWAFSKQHSDRKGKGCHRLRQSLNVLGSCSLPPDRGNEGTTGQPEKTVMKNSGRSAFAHEMQSTG